jgi:hypothetical protein
MTQTHLSRVESVFLSGKQGIGELQFAIFDGPRTCCSL